MTAKKPKSDTDRTVAAARLAQIADVLGLSSYEIPDINDDVAVIEFVLGHGQSLDWVFLGDMRNMIVRLRDARLAERS